MTSSNSSRNCSNLEVSTSQIALAGATRNAVVLLENRTAFALVRKRLELWHGSFHVDHLPSERIAPHSSAIVAALSVGVLIGCEFALTYAVDTRDALLDVYVCAPFIGAPFSSVSSLLPIGVECRSAFLFDAKRRLWLFSFVFFSPPAPAPLTVRWPGLDDPLSLARLEHRSDAFLPSTKGQMVVHVQDFVRDAPPAPAAAAAAAPLVVSDARSFLYVQVLRLRSAPPDDRVPPAGVKLRDEAGALAYVGQHTTVTEPLFWSTPQYVKSGESPLFNEVFVVNVDDVLRDGCVIKLIETSLFGAKQRVLAERRILAAHVLPDAQRRSLIDSLADQLTRLQRLSREYEVLYAAPTHILERLKMKRDIDALEHAVVSLDDAHRAAPREQGIAAAVRFVSTELSAPTDMQHSLHIGFDPQGKFTTRNIPPEWERLFQKAGVLRNELDDAQTFAALVATIGDLAPLSANELPRVTDGTAGGEAGAAAKGVSPKHWLVRRARIAATHALALDVSALDAESRPTDAGTLALLRRRRALLVAASNDACNAAERESDLSVAAAVAAKAAMYGRAADQALVLLGGSPKDHVEAIDVDQLDDSAEALQSSFSEDVINVSLLPNVPLLPPRLASPVSTVSTTTVQPTLSLPPPPPPSAPIPAAPAAPDAAAAPVTPTPTPPLQEQPFEAARLSMMDQIRQGTVLRSHRAELPNLRQLAVTSESTLVDALHEAVIRRRNAMMASGELAAAPAATTSSWTTACEQCGQQLSHSELFQHNCGSA
jgi:hypothetical protein